MTISAQATVDPAPEAVLIDFGGVLTSSVFDAFRIASRQLGGDGDLLLRLFREDKPSARLLVDHECGRLSEDDFEEGLARRLRARGIEVGELRVIRSVQEAMQPDEQMLTAVRALRGGGVPVALVTNSLGDDAYRGYDLAAIADIAVISGEVGVRKPSRRIYALACERLGVAPASAALVDDLAQNLAGAARLGIRGILHRDALSTLAILDAWFGSGQSRRAQADSGELRAPTATPPPRPATR